MQPFNEQLIAARKAKDMTQEALAQAVSVARQTVSNWERGRNLPDVETAQRLSDILGVDLTPSVLPETEPEAPAEAADPAPQAEAAVQSEARRAKKWWIVAGAVALACAALLCFLLIPRHGASGGGLDVDKYRQETHNEADHAWFAFENEIWEEKGESATFDRYNFVLKEQNGVAFSITRIEAQMEGKSGAVRDFNLGADDLRALELDPDVPAYGVFKLAGGQPQGEFKRVGAAFYGNDANGTPLVFYSLIEF